MCIIFNSGIPHLGVKAQRNSHTCSQEDMYEVAKSIILYNRKKKLGTTYNNKHRMDKHYSYIFITILFSNLKRFVYDSMDILPKQIMENRQVIESYNMILFM